MPRVDMAEPYTHGCMSSSSRARYVLIRQHAFPDRHEQHERVSTWDHDHVLHQGRDHAFACMERHCVVGEFGIGSWAREATDDAVMAFIIDYVGADPEATWTGYRVLGTTKAFSGMLVWTLQLFAKDPESDTATYSGQGAPNVRRDLSAGMIFSS